MEKLISYYCFWNENSKQLFDYAMVFTEERKTFKKKKDVMFPLSKKKVQLVVTITSVISSKKGNYSEITTFEGRYFFLEEGGRFF